MTTYSWTTSTTSGTAANFRSWGSTVAPALTAIGMVQTADTGQVDWTTVTAPGSSYTFMGYEIFRFDDALQATAPLFLRVDYGSGINSGDAAFRLTLGKGTTGAGVITGIIFSNVLAGYAGSATVLPCYACSGGSGISIVMAVGLGLGGLAFTIERSADASGNPTGNGVAAMFGTASSAVLFWRVYRYVDPNAWVGGFCPAPLPYTWGNGATMTAASSLVSADAVTAPLQAITLACPGVPPWYSQQHVVAAPGDNAASSLATVTLYGSSKTFRTIGGVAVAGIPVHDSDGGGGYKASAAMRWE